MRGINPETGAPRSRRRPIDWEWVHRVRAYRKEANALRADGYQRVSAFSALPWESPYLTHKIVHSRVSADGTALYVKLEQRP